jgi:hypothetical protein
MDFGSRKAVSLGGTRSRGANGKSKQELLEESRRLRAERERVNAPGKAAVCLTRQARGALERGRSARRLREALLRDASSGAGTAPVLSSGAGIAPVLSLAQRLGWLHRMRARSADAEVAEAVAAAILRTAEPLRGSRCTCGGAAGSVGRAAWNSLVRSACPSLVAAAVAGGGQAASLLSLLLTPAPASLPVCCTASAAAEARRHLDSEAQRCIAGLAAVIHAHALPAATSLLLASLSRAALRIDAGKTVSGGGAAAEGATGGTSAGVETAPELFAAFTRALWPPALLARPPPVGAGRAALREVLRGWGGAERARLVLCVADGLVGWQAEEILTSGAQRHEAAAMLVQLIFTCAAGGGCDWRGSGGWSEASPRLLSETELAPLPGAVASRLVEMLAAGGGQGGAPPMPPVAVAGADAVLALVRSEWRVGPAAEELREEFGGKGDDTEGEASLAADDAGPVAPTQPAGGVACGICFEPPSPALELAGLRCGHRFCVGCWGGLMAAATESGAGCVHAKCPQPGCARRLTGSLWERCLPPGAPAEAWRRPGRW